MFVDLVKRGVLTLVGEIWGDKNYRYYYFIFLLLFIIGLELVQNHAIYHAVSDSIQ